MTVNTRMCIGCGERAEGPAAPALVRVVRGPDGVIAVDAKGGAAGRGAHVHASPTCIEGAAQRGLAKSFKARIEGVATPEGTEPLTARSLGFAIAEALDRRIEGLVASASRARELAIGSDAASGALDRGEAKLALVATDAAASAELSAVRTAVAAGRAVAWGDKARLGALVASGSKPQGVGVVGVTSVRLSRAILDAVHARDASLGAGASEGAPNRSIPRRRRGEAPLALTENGDKSGAGSTNHAERGA